MKRERTVTRTFRISESAFNALQEDARRQNVSVNTLVNQIILSYANFDRYVKKLNMIKIPRFTLKSIMDAAQDDVIIEAGRLAGIDMPKFLILARDGTLSLESVLSHLKSLADYGNLFEYAESSENGKRIITIAHDLGPKGTLFFAHYVQAVFESIDSHPTFTLGDNTIIIEL